MTAHEEAVAARRGELHQQFVSDVFHALSQPLTALRCSLELALVQGGDASVYRAALEEALKQAERVSSCAEFLRVMAEAEDPGEVAGCSLAACVASVVEEFAPVFESSGIAISATADDGVRVLADEEKLYRAIFLALDYGAASGGDVGVRVQTPARLEIRYTCAERRPEDDGERAAQSLKLAEKIFIATGAEVRHELASGEALLQVAWHEPRG